jgi:hypothetical protein
VDETEYQKEYAKAAAELEAAAQATTARGADGKFVKAEEPAKEPEAAKEPVKEPEKEPAKEEKPDELAEIRARLEKAEKIAKDNQAFATRMAQEAAQLRKEREAREREAQKPAILDANPELAEAIRYVAQDPAPQRETEDRQAKWAQMIEQAHPGIFTLPDDDELVQSLLKKRSEAWDDPLVAIREITEEKLAITERQVGKRFAAEAAKLAQKSAMSVPSAGAGSGVMAPVDTQLAEVQRIQKMSDREFQAEVRRVKGL